MNKKTIKLRIVDWYVKDTQENFYKNYFVKILQEKFNVIYSKEPDFIIYGPGGYEHLKYDCVRIFSTGENMRPDYNVADYSMDFDYMEYGDRHFQVLYGSAYNDLVLKKHLISNEDIESKNKFCAFLVTNSFAPYTNLRDECFEKLCEYKKVDSGGKHKNNIGHRVGDKLQWLKNYKFNICFENSSYPGYLTEKLFDAFAAKCVPIYWGDTALLLMQDIENTHGGGG